jgi:DNA-binding LacI/PurR family transcriptional regulator
VTSADVAEAAGVSRATVSYVLNGVHDRISERTRERVFDAAERLGYVPNAVASALRAGRTEVVLLALPPWPLGPAVAEWVSEGVGALEALGYTPLVHFGHGGDARGFARACDRVRPVGLIAPGEELPPARVASLRENGTLGLLAISPEPLEHVMTIVFRQEIVGQVAISHLLERGHERIVALMPSEPEFAEIAAGRLDGARAVAAEHGATVTPVHAPLDAVAAALPPALEQRPTALYAFNDDFALAALEALPEGVAVIGCDDSAPARRANLTSIMLGDPSRWKDYVARLHAMIEGADDRTPLVDLPKVVARAST